MKRKTGLILPLVLFVAFIAYSSAEQIQTHENLNSTLWVQTSAEYRVIAEQAYALAKEKLDIALKDRAWTAAIEQVGNYSELPPAIILDVDETVLDNSPFEAELIKRNQRFNRQLWTGWVLRSHAQPVPGAIEFVKYAHEEGVEVFFVTNRDHKTESATRENLRNLGFPLNLEMDTVLTRNERPDWGSDKSSRRRFVAGKYRILLLFGDDLNDFVSGAKAPQADRIKLAAKYRSFWGERWFLLPNPDYGSWEGTLYDYDYALPIEEKLKRKYEKLRPFR